MPDIATKPKVLSAMSGGVDSALATQYLQEQGYEVVGSMMRLWADDLKNGAQERCCSPDAAYDARRMADKIDIPFYLTDYHEKFEEIIIDPFVEQYEAGETPNPCIWCNRDIKFGSFLKKAHMLGCDYMATGHFVRRIDSKKGVELHRGFDLNKDQTYFLWALPKEMLPYLLFPLGEMTKDEVRSESAKRGITVAYKKSSYDLCFIKTNMKDYLNEHSQEKTGPILDASDNCKQIGEHKGIQFYTIGQRKGLGLYHSHLVRFVIDLQADGNKVIVGSKEQCQWLNLRTKKANFLLETTGLPKRVSVLTRYRMKAAMADLLVLDDDSFELKFDEPVFAITKGQSAVIYDGDRLLGGGVVAERW